MIPSSEADILNAYHLARLAAWSGDQRFCLQQCNKVVPRKYARTLTAKVSAGYDIPDSRLRMIEYSTSLLRKAILPKGIDANDTSMVDTNETEGTTLALVTSPALRGIIHIIEPVVFELRAFPSRPTADERREAMEQLRDLRDKSLKSLASSDGVPSEEWIFSTNPYMRVEFNQLGQIRALGFWCEPPSVDSVRVAFLKLLKSVKTK